MTSKFTKLLSFLCLSLMPIAIQASPALITTTFGVEALSELERSAIKMDPVHIAESYDSQDYQASLYSIQGGLTGALGAIARINVTEASTRLFKIPAEATYFSWVYPIFDFHSSYEKEAALAEVWYDATQLSALKSFMNAGGFVYFDSEFNLIAANAFVQGKNMIFSRHSPENLKKHRPLLDQLYSASRFQNVTLQGLLAQGAESFAWVNPGELQTDERDDESDLAAFGGFVYKRTGDEYDLYPLMNVSSEEDFNRLASIADRIVEIYRNREAGDTRDIAEIALDMEKNQVSLQAAIDMANKLIENDCSVCMLDLQDADRITLLPCQHRSTCAGCIEEIRTQRDNRCPICRAEITEVRR